MTAVSATHNDVGLLLIKCVGLWIDAYDLGELKYEPFQMKTGPNLPGRSPDILFVAKKNLSRLRKTCLDGPADMVIENRQ